MIFEISAKFCQKATNSPPKKIYWQNWPQIWGSFAHLLSKKIWNFFCQILTQISKKYGILIIGSRTLKITPSGGSPSGFHPPQDPHNGPPNTVLDILESHKCIIKRQIFWYTLVPVSYTNSQNGSEYECNLRIGPDAQFTGKGQFVLLICEFLVQSLFIYSSSHIESFPNFKNSSCWG